MNLYKPTRKLENRMMEIARLRKRIRALEIDRYVKENERIRLIAKSALAREDSLEMDESLAIMREALEEICEERKKNAR
tara:strand:- start:1941 stop:2177 length:237 start_codon:yes stop_codon:yes gene_type:complete